MIVWENFGMKPSPDQFAELGKVLISFTTLDKILRRISRTAWNSVDRGNIRNICELHCSG